MEFTIDPEFRDLLPKLSEDERQRLVSDVNQNGCRDKLVVWKEWNILIDGHNRYEICSDLDLPFETTELSFPSRDDVKMWMFRNQLGRRNLTDFQRAEIALRMKPVVAEAAKSKKAEAGGDRGNQYTGGKVAVTQTFVEPPLDKRSDAEANAIVAKEAGVSRETIRKVETILKDGNQELIDKLRSGEKADDGRKMTINKAYKTVKPPVVQKPVEAVIEPVAVAVVEPVKVEPVKPEPIPPEPKPEPDDVSEFKIDYSRVPKAKDTASPEITMEMRLKAVGLRRANAAIAEMRMIPNGDPQLEMAHELMAGYLRNCGIAKIKKG